MTVLKNKTNLYKAITLLKCVMLLTLTCRNLSTDIGRHMAVMGAQWLSGRVLDSRSKGCGFEPHQRHCVVVLEQDSFILA